MALNKKITDLEKDLIISNEKLTNYKEKLGILENKQVSESETLNEQIMSIKANFKKEKSTLA